MVAGILLCTCKAGCLGLRPLRNTDSLATALLIVTLAFTQIIPLTTKWKCLMAA